MSSSVINPAMDVVAVWKLISADFKVMTPEEKTETLVSAGILTQKGNVRSPYKDVIVPVGKKSKAR